MLILVLLAFFVLQERPIHPSSELLCNLLITPRLGMILVSLVSTLLLTMITWSVGALNALKRSLMIRSATFFLNIIFILSKVALSL